MTWFEAGFYLEEASILGSMVHLHVNVHVSVGFLPFQDAGPIIVHFCEQSVPGSLLTSGTAYRTERGCGCHQGFILNWE